MAATTPHNLRVLFITRAYPPVVGGMETLSAEFIAAVGAKTPSFVIANRYGKAALPFFLPTAALQLRRRAHQFDVVHLGDPLLTCLLPAIVPVGPIRPIARQREAAHRPSVVVTIHGLDILYPHPLYQALLHRFLPRVDLALCISRFVEQKVHTRFPGLATVVITPGIHTILSSTRGQKADLARALGASLGSDALILTVARLVQRKGIAWFVESVLPAVPRAHFLIIGDGPERMAIAQAASRAGVTRHVTLAGAVPEETLQLAYRTADVFVLPNIPTPSDAEGFGIVALEASAAGLPVLAADLEGLKDAVLDGQTGQLVPAGDAAAWVEAVTHLVEHPAASQRIAARAPPAVREHFSWDHRAVEVLEAFARLREPASAPRA